MEEQLENQQAESQSPEILGKAPKATQKKTPKAEESTTEEVVKKPKTVKKATETIVAEVAEIEPKTTKRPRKIKPEVTLVTESAEGVGLVEVSHTANEVKIQSENIAALEAELEEHSRTVVDYSSYSVAEINDLLSQSLAALQSTEVTIADFKKADGLLKETKPVIDQVKATQKKEALEKFKDENEGETEGFEWTETAEVQNYENTYKQIKDIKGQHFADVEKNKEKNFQTKTEIINTLRQLTDSEDNSLNSVKENLAKIRKLQHDWKDAGNVASPHNNTLWQTYHALIDRFYSNRGIYFELLDLDRKKNLNHKIELCIKVEQLSETAKNDGLTSKMLNDANHVFEEYKHIGPASREANEIVWQRFKTALDTLYDLRRAQLEDLKGTFEKNYEAKQEIFGSLALFTSFKSDSINDWLDQTKAIDILQQQWNAIKGPMPKDKGRDLSREFWTGVKLFYKNKGDFFRALEAKRAENLTLKTALCEQVEAILAESDNSQQSTQTIIKLQEDWRKIGHVPEKFRNKIFDRFKKACDEYFNRKRTKSSETEQVFVENLAKKEALCKEIEDAAKNSGASIDDLNQYKSRWAELGYVPKTNMQSIQKRYIASINAYVGALGKLSANEKEALQLQSEVELMKGSNNKMPSKDLGKRESEIRNKISFLENDLSTLKNNLEFFAKSKNADKLKADFEQKINRGEDEIKQLKHKLKVIREAGN